LLVIAIAIEVGVYMWFGQGVIVKGYGVVVVVLLVDVVLWCTLRFR